MKDLITKILGFAVIFVVSVMVISSIMNRGSTDMTVDMKKASLPVVGIKTGSGIINRLYGYTGKVDVSKVRGYICQLDEKRGLSFIIRKYGAEVKGLYFEVRSMDGERLIERTDITDVRDHPDEIEAAIRVKDLIDANTQYSLCIGFTDVEGRDVRYYTRIIYNSDLRSEELSDFVRTFSKATLDKEEARTIAMYLESNELGDNTDFAHVNIHSSFDQITFGKLRPEIISDMDIKIYDVDVNGGFFGNAYRIEAGPEGMRHEYEVEEFFRLKITPKRIYLIDYERTMKEVFIPDSDHFVNDKIMFGITDNDINFMENNDGDIVAFVQNGALYCYRGVNNRAVRIFSFFDDENNDERTRLKDHEIKILSVDEGGNIRFLLYGYMNRGKHEGEVLAGVYYYDSSLNTIEEEVIIPYDGSFAGIKSNLDLLAFEDRSNNFYFYLSQGIYRIRMGSARTEILASDIGVDDFVVSESMGIVAWTDELMKVGSADTMGVSIENSEITVLNLSTGTRRLISADPGMVCIPVGFIGEDLVYGTVDKGGVVRTAAGTMRLVMKYLYIESPSGEVLKKYDAGDRYISDVEIKGNAIDIVKIRIDSQGTVMDVENDQIVGSGRTKDTHCTILSVLTEETETIVEMQVYQEIRTDSMQLLTPKEVVYEGVRSVKIEGSPADTTETYVVYAKGFISGIYSSLSSAIEKADEDAGVVVFDVDKYAWAKMGKENEKSIPIEEVASFTGNGLYDCMMVLLEYTGKKADIKEDLEAGRPPINILKENMDATVLNLEGCTLDEVLYYVSSDRPVFAPSRAGSLLITGYDTKNIEVFNPSEESIHKIGLDDAKELFESRGNEFISYVR
ncbi:MAG: hypothetical protein K6F86_10050 [Lachnospiraceae bacterium]|nr:hypothetical protein [Lachnospiraceae bacterium]